MWSTIAPAEMKRIETNAMARGLCTGEELMQRAALAVAEAVRRCRRTGKVIALCGTGNNGGDAFAAMRILAADDAFSGECWLLDGRLSQDGQRELNRLQQEFPQVIIRQLRSESEYAQKGVLLDETGKTITLDESVGCLIDGLFGTGLSRPVAGTAAALCRLACEAYEAGVPVIAVDIPSGLCGSTGQVLGHAVHATETITFHRPKPGLFLRQGLDVSGRITVSDIELLPAWDDADGLPVCQPEDVPTLLPCRNRTGHKGDHGRVTLLCGSTGMAGAAALAATAALRTGAGLVTVACPESILNIVQTLCPCATCLPLSGNVQEAWAQLKPLLENADALGMGCGMGQSLWAQGMVRHMFQWLSCQPLPAVIDADALNLLSQMDATELNLSHCILTPHPGEAARLLGSSVAEIINDAPGSANQLHKQYGASIVLKGATSVLVTAEGAALHVLGTSAMGKGGSGDVLTGVLCALLAERTRQPHHATMLTVLQAGCGLHGLAGCAAEKRYGNRGVLATDLCRYLGLAAEPGRCNTCP